MRLRSSGFVSSPFFSRHDHKNDGEHEFHFFTSGTGTLHNGPSTARYAPGRLFFTPAGIIHEAQGDKSAGFYFFRFSLDASDIELKTSLTERFGEKLYADIGPGYAADMETVRARHADADPRLRKAADFGFAALLYAILAERGMRAGLRDQSYVAEAKRLMLLSVEKSIEVADIARKLGLDSSYFIRVFKRVTGTTPLSYFLGLKMDTAKHLLLDGSRTVRSVAELLGFQDELYFSRLFKRRIGVSPSAYRSS